MRSSLVDRLKSKTLDFIERAKIPVCIGDVAKHLRVSWATARQILAELELEGAVTSEKTSKSKIFRPRRGRDD
jgi:predicted ArsR family transcriptional regulator